MDFLDVCQPKRLSCIGSVCTWHRTIALMHDDFQAVKYVFDPVLVNQFLIIPDYNESFDFYRINVWSVYQ